MAGKKPSLEAEIAELYGEPLEQWTAARNALAARLRGAGRKADAEAVKALRKPSASAWAVNQLFRDEGERMDELLAAGKRARAAQGQAVAGRGAEVFREALKAARRQIEELRRRAAELLAKDGKKAGAAVVERVGTNLEALAFSPAAAAQGARGYLDADLDPPGFEVLTGVQLAAPTAPTSRAPRTPPASRRAEPPPAPARPSRLLQFKKPPAETRAETRAAAAARKREEAEAARRAREEERRRERVERAAVAVGQAEEKAAALRGEADDADRQAAEAQRQATAAERAAAAVRRRAEAAEAELARARERLAAERSGS
jgi:hypothetical protein